MSTIRLVSSTSYLSHVYRWTTAPARALWNYIGSWNAGGTYRSLRGRTAISASDPRIPSPQRSQPALQAAPIAPPAPVRPIARALPQEMAAKKIHWKGLSDVELSAFSRRASMNAIIAIMDPTLTASLSLQIIHESFQSKQSLLSIFMEKLGDNYRLLDKIKISLKYFFLYYCGLIPNILDAFLETALARLRSDLSQPGAATALVDKVLSRADSFLTICLQAIDTYAASDGKEDLDQLLSRALNQPIDRISREFIETSLREFFPRISLFKKLKNHPYHLSAKAIAWLPDNLFNWLIRKVLTHQLPPLCQSLIQTSIKYTQPDNPAFAAGITRAVLAVLKQAKKDLNGTQTTTHPTPLPPVTEQRLSAIVEKAYRILQLHSHNKTPAELQAQIKNGPGMISNVLASQLKGLIVKGGRAGLSHLSNPANAEEVLYLLLQQVNASFTPSTQNDSVDTLKAAMHREVEEVLQMGIAKAAGHFAAPVHYLVGDKITELVDNGYEIILKPHLWKRLILDIIRSVNKAYR